MPATKTCTHCLGDGTVLRPVEEIRKLPDGRFDPTDIRRREVCSHCGGGGMIPENYAGLKDKAAGFVADQI